ncbi:hypothetical protein [Georgenia alba]|uniref:Uncharacterized protein n=1 Tax=Georgenia alba TaxID=2233858 RepID=A0ABW2Q2X2_9MICO
MTPTEFSPGRSDAIRVALIRTAEGGARRRRLVRSGSLVVCGAIAGVGLSAAAVAAGGGLTPDESGSRWNAADYFLEMAEQPGFMDGGRGSDGRHDLEVFWRGPLGEEARAIVQRAEADGISVEVTHMPRSNEEAQRALLQYVMALEDAGIETLGFGITGQNDVIRIWGPEVSVDPQVQQRAREILESTLGQAFTIEFVPNDPIVPAPATPAPGSGR